VSVPAVAIETQGYTDVNPGNIWYEDIMEATEEGIVSGIGNGQFAPDRPVTMLGFATMLGRYLNRFEGLDAYWLESPLLMINAYLDANNGHAAGDCLTRRDAVCLVFAAAERGTLSRSGQSAFGRAESDRMCRRAGSDPG